MIRLTSRLGSTPVASAVLLTSLALASLLAGTRSEAREPATTQRVPGTIRLPGDPDGIGAFRLVRAFPKLRFQRPLWVGEVPDGSGRLWVIEQDGVIRSFPNRRDASGSEAVLDWRSRTFRGHNEEGLLGLAFSPTFARDRQVFLHYSANRPRRGVVSRFRMAPSGRHIDPRSERVVLTQAQPWGNHNGGDLRFGPDGMLYVTFGDGGAGGDPKNSGQDRSTWLGSILRLDVRTHPYAVPPDNPFVGTRGVRPEIWAYGLRNVWRMAFDRQTGELWAGDVGQNAWEEIDVITRGGNYGWRLREGKHPFRHGGGRGAFRTRAPSRLIDPVIEHDTSQARSITGGFVYRGARVPTLEGVYLYADYVTGNVWGLRRDAAGAVRNRLLARQGGISSFGEDAAGEVYATAFDGYVYRFQASPKASAAGVPARLSATGLFADTPSHRPHRALIPYEVNTPLWSDGAAKQRFVMLPGFETIAVRDDGTWDFPVGTLFVKTFHAGTSVQAPRLETRVFARLRQGWVGYTYVWDDDQRDARLAHGRLEIPLRAEQGLGSTWSVPSRADCMACHTQAAGFVLGFRPEQLSRPRAPDDALRRLSALGCFDRAPARTHAFPVWDAESGVAADANEGPGGRVRAYLDANCAMCHQPTGPGNARIDLRFETPLARTGLLAKPTQGELGVPEARLVAPGEPARSLLRVRMARTDEQGMPNLAHNRVDARALEAVDAWINGLKR